MVKPVKDVEKYLRLQVLRTKLYGNSLRLSIKACAGLSAIPFRNLKFMILSPQKFNDL